jgi:hypothetical protein
MTNWWFYLEIDWNSITIIDGVKYYATKDGCLKLFPDGVIQYITNGWYKHSTL